MVRKVSCVAFVSGALAPTVTCNAEENGCPVTDVVRDVDRVLSIPPTGVVSSASDVTIMAPPSACAIICAPIRREITGSKHNSIQTLLFQQHMQLPLDYHLSPCVLTSKRQRVDPCACCHDLICS